MSVAWGDYGSYATDIFTQEAAQAGGTKNVSYIDF
jgi:hypothetical protein